MCPENLSGTIADNKPNSAKSRTKSKPPDWRWMCGLPSIVMLRRSHGFLVF